MAKLYLTLKSIPELSDLPKEERTRLWRENAPKSLRHPKTWTAFVVYAIIMTLGCVMSLQIHPWFPFGYLLAGSICALSFLIFLQLWIPIVRIYLKEEVNRNDIDASK